MLRDICHYPRRQLQSIASRSFSEIKYSKKVKVQVRQGIVVGREERLPNGESFRCFQGIPYAVPPLGKLRFQPPLPLDRFDTPELDCIRTRDPCQQQGSKKIIGSEDCLYLNLYTPAKSSTQPLPVMLFIHGGGFTTGHGHEYLPLSLVSEDVIVVKINYRLNFWGFACLPEAGIWGNAGLKDQRLALQWVQENIASFNGDPNNVTLFGQSSGSVSVHLHTLASHAHKLFHKAIMQSGTANVEWAFQRKPREKVFRICEMLGCLSKNPKEIREFLQSPDKVAPEAITSKTMYLLSPDERRRGPPFPLRPVIEDSNSPEAFITTPVHELLQYNKLTMPTIIGYNSGEGFVLLAHSRDNLNEVSEDLARFVPRSIPLPFHHPEIKLLAEKMRKFYFGGRKLTPEHIQQLCHLLTDYYFLIDIRLATKMQAIHQPGAPLYAYRFDYNGERDFYKQKQNFTHLSGACHTDDLFYFFQNFKDDLRTFNESDAQMTKYLSAMWANFARDGNPTPPNSAVRRELGIEWTAIKRPQEEREFAMNYMMIGQECSMQQDPDINRVQFWQDIYKNYGKTEDYSILNYTL